jgi:hypothetical protein
LKPKNASKDISEFAEVEIPLVQYNLFVLEENVVHQRSKSEDLSTVSNPHRFVPPTATLDGIAEKKKKLLTCTQEITRAKLK